MVIKRDPALCCTASSRACPLPGFIPFRATASRAVQPLARQHHVTFNAQAGGFYGAGYVSDEEWGEPTKGSTQQATGMMAVLQGMWQWARGAFESLVGTSTNAFLISPLAPPEVSRTAVENSVRGGLALLGLTVIKSMLSVVLMLGLAALFLYVANQVYGIGQPGASGPAAGPHAPPRHTRPPGPTEQAGSYAGRQYKHYRQYAWNGEPDPGIPYTTGNNDPGYDYVARDPQTGPRIRRVYRGAGGAPGGTSSTGRPQQSWVPPQQQSGKQPAKRPGDVIDVYYDPLTKRAGC